MSACFSVFSPQPPRMWLCTAPLLYYLLTPAYLSVAAVSGRAENRRTNSPPPTPLASRRVAMADDDEANDLLDARLLAYLHAYQEYTVLTVELQSVLREGHIKLAHARRELSRTTR